MSVLSMKRLLGLGLAGLLSPVLLAGVSEAEDHQAPVQIEQYGATLDCTNQEILTWCFADNAEDDALSHCEDYIANTPEQDGCTGGSTVSSECGSSYWKIAAYVCP